MTDQNWRIERDRSPQTAAERAAVAEAIESGEVRERLAEDGADAARLVKRLQWHAAEVYQRKLTTRRRRQEDGSVIVRFVVKPLVKGDE